MEEVCDLNSKSSLEPHLLAASPSSHAAQDISHIIADVFKGIYKRKVFDKETTNNLIKSSHGSTSDHHRKCMKQLEKAEQEYEKLIEEYNTVEQHIIEARTRAEKQDKKNLKKAAGKMGVENYLKLGLPPIQSSFR